MTLSKWLQAANVEDGVKPGGQVCRSPEQHLVLLLQQPRHLRTVVIEFADLETARAAHGSPAYQEALAAHGGSAVRDMRIVPGVWPE